MGIINLGDLRTLLRGGRRVFYSALFDRTCDRAGRKPFPAWRIEIAGKRKCNERHPISQNQYVRRLLFRWKATGGRQYIPNGAQAGGTPLPGFHARDAIETLPSCQTARTMSVHHDNSVCLEIMLVRDPAHEMCFTRPN